MAVINHLSHYATLTPTLYTFILVYTNYYFPFVKLFFFLGMFSFFRFKITVYHLPVMPTSVTSGITNINTNKKTIKVLGFPMIFTLNLQSSLITLFLITNAVSENLCN